MGILFQKVQDVPSRDIKHSSQGSSFPSTDAPIATPISSRQNTTIKSAIEAGADIYRGSFPKGLTVVEAPAKTVKTKGPNAGTLKWHPSASDYSATYTGSSLSEASRLGSLKQVKHLLDHSVDPNGNPKAKEATPLQCAAYHSHLAVMDLLISRGASISRSHGSIGTALHAAALNGSISACRLLLSRGAYIEKRAGRCGTPLEAAAYGRNTATVRFLLAKGANFDEWAPWGWSRWDELSPSFQEGVVDDIMSSVKYDNVVEASMWGATPAVELFLRNSSGKAVHSDKDSGYSDADSDSADMVELRDPILGRTALSWAAVNGDVDTAKVCLAHGADAEVPDMFGSTPMVQACAAGCVDVVRELKAAGVKSGVADKVLMEVKLAGAFDNVSF